MRVIPRARKTEVSGERDGQLLIRVAAPPVDDAANDTLVEFLARTLGVPRRAVRIVSGARSRNKRVAISGVSRSDVDKRLLTLG